MGILALQPFRFDAIANKITRNGFADILRFLYFNDNEHAMLDRRHLSCDQFYKVLPILEMYVNSCRKPEGQEKNSIDEAVEISSDFAPADVVLKLAPCHEWSGRCFRRNALTLLA
ncbi:Histidinol dehydrogenase [Trichinella pseudospiralis]